MIIAINKPVGPTSFDIVAKVRKITGIKKVGHAGTLDPLASGVLVVAVGRDATKTISAIVEKEKEYVAEITLGKISETDDAQGVVRNNFQFSIFNFQSILNFKIFKNRIAYFGMIPSEAKIKKALNKFAGEINQVPPQFSAIKIGGKRAYKSARQGHVVEMASRPVLVKEIELLEYDYPILKIRVVTGPGVYIRSLARDIGQELGTGAYMSGLVRTRVGEYKIDEALTIDEFKKQYDNEKPVD